MHKTTSLNNKNTKLRNRSRNVNPLQEKLFSQIHTLDVEESNIVSLNTNANKDKDRDRDGRNFSRQQPIKYQNKFRIMDSTLYNTNKPGTGVGFRRLYTRQNSRRQYDTNAQTHSHIHNYNKQDQEHTKTFDQDFNIITNTGDPLAKLISKAKQITLQNKQLIQKTRKQMKKQKQGTFLTGTGLYQQQTPNQCQYTDECELDQNSMLRYLVKTQQQDDLAQLRRMIKITDKNLNTYENQMYLSSQNVAVAADQFKKQLDTGLLNKMGKIKIYDAGEFNANSYGGGYDRSKRKYKGIDRKYV